ncbi:arginine N-succinyltransferase [uncultured Halopseudomonas sp.]|uniref:arginine N-succinyltransferase n=1 Tax=uncultured Halopseudomonas sp. TaxID=2901193 RepID=UPI0030EB57AE|tara:strand:- start:6198 stop:7217 length:1020 start_codon:yes stop_codon:yes gene_type:complete
MLVQRLSRISDLPEIRRLAASSPAGVTALPDDERRLAEILEASEASMTEEISFSGEERYFFVIEDTVSGSLAGCSSVVASAGFSEPFYAFRNEMFVHASRQLGLHNRMHVLSLCHDLTGHSLLSGFHLEPDYQHADAVTLNARGRLLFMASHPQRFADSTSVEIVGISDEEGNAPFWDAVGRHFFAVTYSEAERIGSSRGRSCLAELMPGYPIYVPMLSDEAQEVIGQVHPSAERVFDLLMQEGFETDNYVDIFDGGPVVHARTRELHTVRNSLVMPVEVGEMPAGDESWLVANGRISDFRACVMQLFVTPDQPVVLDQHTADLLGVVTGDTLRLAREV